ncbi:MAG: nitroreductase family protein [Candidatus Thorarchaeota archaeon]|nr:nitroreductase family protein [Candidatus Thorarchaeota archaeon]
MDRVMREIRERRSGRAYSDRPVGDAELESILEAGRLAPSCSNTQAWNFVVLRTPEALAAGHEALSRGNAYGKKAPVMILVAAKEDGGCPAHGLPYFMMDVGLAVENMLLQAVHLGLMGHPIAGWDEAMLKKSFGIPDEYRIVTVVFFGYAADLSTLDDATREKELQRSTRRPLSEVVHWNKW